MRTFTFQQPMLTNSTSRQSNEVKEFLPIAVDTAAIDNQHKLCRSTNSIACKFWFDFITDQLVARTTLILHIKIYSHQTLLNVVTSKVVSFWRNAHNPMSLLCLATFWKSFSWSSFCTVATLLWTSQSESKWDHLKSIVSFRIFLFSDQNTFPKVVVWECVLS